MYNTSTGCLHGRWHNVVPINNRGNPSQNDEFAPRVSLRPDCIGNCRHHMRSVNGVIQRTAQIFETFLYRVAECFNKLGPGVRRPADDKTT